VIIRGGNACDTSLQANLQPSGSFYERLINECRCLSRRATSTAPRLARRGRAASCHRARPANGSGFHITSLVLCAFSRNPKGLFRNFIKPGGDVQCRTTGTRSNTSFLSPFYREQQSFLCPLRSITYYQGPEVVWMLSSSWVPSQMTHWRR